MADFHNKNDLIEVIIEKMIDEKVIPPVIFEPYQLPHILHVRHNYQKETNIWYQVGISIPDYFRDEIQSRGINYVELKRRFYKDLEVMSYELSGPIKKEKAPIIVPISEPGKKFCDACGITVPLDDVFCYGCGEELEAIE